jgi:hypothetical protein
MQSFIGILNGFQRGDGFGIFLKQFNVCPFTVSPDQCVDIIGLQIICSLGLFGFFNHRGIVLKLCNKFFVHIIDGQLRYIAGITENKKQQR